MIPQGKISKLQDEILVWYAIHKRDLPWRRTREPYNILLSEVMSQQTQLSRVIPKYTTWLEELPTIYDLASASIVQVLTLWSGLGYNRRALFLQKAARAIVSNFKGKFPQDEHILQTLPGIGEYTACAIACFAFDKQIAVVDTNVRKVIAVKLFDGILPEERVIKATAARLLPNGKAYEWNQALMDYSAHVLKKDKIPIPRQSTFATSDRRFRGQLIKYLLETKTLHVADAHAVLFQKTGVRLENDRLKRIIDALVKDSLVIVDTSNKIQLP